MQDHSSHQHKRQGYHTLSPQVHFSHSEIQDLCKQGCFPPEVHILDYSQADLEIHSVFHVSLFLENDDKSYNLKGADTGGLLGFEPPPDLYYIITVVLLNFAHTHTNFHYT